MKKSVLNTALSTAFIVALGFGISACSGDKEGESHEVLAKDRVDEAAELARKNAPEAEELNFPETAPMPAAEADAAASTEATTTTTEEGAADTVEATASADAEVADTETESAEAPATDAATTDATPVAN
ncbi:putative membrane protein [Psychrobacter luti]|uniref:Putative membrane protein n=1 Tax=Psychrobacter luti TaxID=198481 RepID=A0A839TE55_9GAMM|nr:hypothetical protein [Psychrobacter luti]MBB3106696.1 putative membrane protein [Psychrobacter luti]